MVKIEVIKHAIKQAMEDVGPTGSSHDDIKHDHHLLSKLMSQVFYTSSNFFIYFFFNRKLVVSDSSLP